MVSEQTQERPLRVGSFVMGPQNSQWPGSRREEGRWRGQGRSSGSTGPREPGHRDMAGGAGQGGCRGARLRGDEGGGQRRERTIFEHLQRARLRWLPHTVTESLEEADGLKAVFRERFQWPQFC